MKFLHLAATNRNVGDNALISGIKNLFFKDELILKNIRSTIVDTELINTINNYYDGLIIGGGGLLHSSPVSRKQKINSSGTLIRLDTSNIDKIKKPIIVYGVGYNVFEGEMDLSDLAKKSILDMIKHCCHFSVRNDGSKEKLLNFLDSDNINIIEVPDPGLYCSSNIDKYKYLNNNTKKIAIQIAADRLKYRFKNNNEIILFIDEIKKFIKKIDANCWLVPHTLADKKFIKDNFKGYNIFPLKKLLYESSTVMGFYQQMDCVIGQRGHANICAFGLNVPIISLVSHAKNIGFMEKIGFSEYAVQANDKELHEKLIILFNSIGESYYNKQLYVNQELREKSLNIVEKIYESM